MEYDYFKENMGKWRLKELLTLTNTFEEVFSNAVNEKGINEETYETILANICGKTLVTSREIITLCANGYPDGALSLARNVFEQMIIIAFFEQRKNNPDFIEIVEKYFKNYTIQRNRILRDIYEMRNDSNKEREYRQKLRDFKDDNNISDIRDYWWSGYNSFSELCKAVIKIEASDDKLMNSLLCQLYSNYKRACLSIHANCMGNAIRLGKDSYIGLVDTSPTTKGQEHPLHFLTLSLIYIVCTSCKIFEIDYKTLQKDFTVLASFYSIFQRTHIREHRYRCSQFCQFCTCV
mgnify:CR=1 FL=1